MPKYDNNSRPYGTWTAKTLLTTNEWRTSGDFNHDIGFAVMNPLGGQTLTAAVGGSYPIAFNLGYNLTFDAYGYPAANPYNGQTLWRCSGPTTMDSRGSTDNRLPCSMTGGSSGGGGASRLVSSLTRGFRRNAPFNRSVWLIAGLGLRGGRRMG